MPPETQAKVLRVLQERSFERVGGTTPIAVDVRVVAATHRDLEARGRGRPLPRGSLLPPASVVEIALPPLRERREDMPALAQRFLAQVAERLGRPQKRARRRTRSRRSRATPGPATCASCATRSSARRCSRPATRSTRATSLLGGTPATAPRAGDAERLVRATRSARAVEDFERAYLLRALRAHGGNVSRTAEAIGMVRQSLQQKMRELGCASAPRRRRARPSRS